MSRRSTVVAAALAALVLPLAAACVPNDARSGRRVRRRRRAHRDLHGRRVRGVGGRGAVGHAACSRSPTTGDDVTEFYLLGEDGLRVVSEVENVGPGLTRDLVVQVKPGTYYTACKPGMVGDGIRAEFTVTDSRRRGGPDG